MTASLDRSDAGEIRQSSVVVHNACWCCGQMLEKVVPRRNHRHQYFTWRCQPCDVEWTGPGT
jgi:hypothetical protein